MLESSATITVHWVEFFTCETQEWLCGLKKCHLSLDFHQGEYLMGEILILTLQTRLGSMMPSTLFQCTNEVEIW